MQERFNRADSRLIELVQAHSQTKLTPRQAQKIAYNAQCWPIREDHKQWSGKVWYHTHIRDRYGKNGSQLLRDTGFFSAGQWDHSKEMMRSWRLTDAYHDIQSLYWSDNRAGTVTEWPDAARKPRRARKPKRVIERLSGTGARADDIPELMIDPEPDIESMKVFIADTEAGTDPDKNKLLSQAKGYVKLSETNIGTSGSYRQTSTGRVMGTDLHLQQCNKKVCSAAFPGCYECDAENCHYCILQQLAAEQGYSTPTISRYLENKKVWREDLARFCHAPSDDIKACLIALIYWANLSPHNSASIGRRLGYRAAQLFCSHPDVKALHKEITTAGNIVIVEAIANAKRNQIINASGLPISRNAKSASILAHILQGAEANIMKTVISESGQNIRLWKHDGIITDAPIETDSMKEHIQEKTGFSIELKTECI